MTVEVEAEGEKEQHELARPLAELLGITHESRAGTLQALFTYIRLHKLQVSAPPSHSTMDPLPCVLTLEYARLCYRLLVKQPFLHKCFAELLLCRCAMLVSGIAQVPALLRHAASRRAHAQPA